MSPARSTRLHLVHPETEPRQEPKAGPALDDSALLAGLDSHDPAVSAAFYDRVRPIVDRTLSRLLGTRDQDYEDLAQVALFELVSTIDKFRGECPLDAWLSIVSARVVYRHIRRRRLERRLFAAAPVEELTTNVSTMPAAFASREAVTRVKDHLSKMDTNRAWTYLLHDVYGYDLKEIKDIMGASLSATQSRLVRGRRELHDRIRRDPEFASFLDELMEGAS